MIIEKTRVAGILLAGGLSRRMGGGDKCLRVLGGETILSRIVRGVLPQVDTLALNANGDPSRFSSFGLPVIPDVIEGNAGPLSGVLTGMEWVALNYPECEWLVSFPTDAPFLPENLVESLMFAMKRDGSDVACARSNGRTHPVIGIWPVQLRGALRKAMTEEDIRKVDLWTSRYRLSVVDFTSTTFDPFFNTNRPEDLERAEAILAGT